MPTFELLTTENTIGSAEIKHAQRGRFLYAAVTLQIAFKDKSAKHIAYNLSVPEDLDEYHLQAVRPTEVSDVKDALEKGVVLGLEQGIIEGFPQTDYQVTILQVIRSVGESSTVALTAAAAKAVWNALQKSAPQSRGKGKDFEDWLWIDFDEKANRWNLHLANQ